MCVGTTPALHASYICAVGPIDSGCTNNNQRSLSTVEYKVRLTLLTLYSAVDKDLPVEMSCIISFNYCYVCCSGLFFLLIENEPLQDYMLLLSLCLQPIKSVETSVCCGGSLPFPALCVCVDVTADHMDWTLNRLHGVTH